MEGEDALSKNLKEEFYFSNQRVIQDFRKLYKSRFKKGRGRVPGRRGDRGGKKSSPEIHAAPKPSEEKIFQHLQIKREEREKKRERSKKLPPRWGGELR